MLNKGGKTIYRRQLAVIAFICNITYKLLMLPRYMAQSAGRQAWIAVLLMMTLEAVLFIFIYALMKRNSFFKLDIPKFLKAFLALVVLFTVVTKSLVLLSESMDYINTVLFEEGTWDYKLIALLMVVGFIAHKGANVLARTAQITFLVLLVAVVVAAATFETTLQWDNILPIMPDGPGSVLYAADKHLIWFADCTPLLFLSLADKKKDKDKFSIPLMVIVTYIVVVLFFIFFTALYGDAGVMVSHVFANLASYTVADGLEGVMFPLILCWIMMAVVRLSLLTFCGIECGQFFFKKRLPVTLGFLVLVLILMLTVGGLEENYALATSSMRYFAATIQYALPVLLFAYIKIKETVDKKKTREKDKGEERDVEYSEDKAENSAGA